MTNPPEREGREREHTAFERALLESEQRYRAVVQQVSEAIFLLDVDTMCLLEANPAFQRLLGYGPEDIEGLSIYDLLPYERERVDRTTRNAVERGEYSVGDRLYRRKDGSLVNVEVGITPITYGGRTVLCEVLRDITERKKLEQRKDDFIALASHELKTPVTSLRIFAQGLLKRFRREADSEPARGAIRQIERMNEQLDKLAELVQSLLDVSRLEAGKLDYSMSEVDLAELLRETVEDLQRLSDKHTLVLESEGGTGGTEVVADRERIRQVITNLLTNAIKYSPQGGRVEIACRRSEGDDKGNGGEEVVVSVRDFGIGIPEDQKERVFERFYQVSRQGGQEGAADGVGAGQAPAVGTYPGLGLGLYLSWAIVRRHGGRIWVESQEGSGSTFYFALPRASGRDRDDEGETL